MNKSQRIYVLLIGKIGIMTREKKLCTILEIRGKIYCINDKFGLTLHPVGENSQHNRH